MIFSPCEPSRKARGWGTAAGLLGDHLRTQTVAGAPGCVEEPRLVLNQIIVAQVGLVGVRLTGVVVALLETAAAQLSKCLWIYVPRFLPGLNWRAGQSRGLRVLRTWTWSSGATEGLGGCAVVILGAEGFFSG